MKRHTLERVLDNEESEGLYHLPNGWMWVRLGEITKIVLGQSPPSSTYNEKRTGLPFYQGKAEFGDIYPTPQKWCSVPKKIAEKGDVLISVRAPVGPTNICPEKSCIGRGIAAIRGLGGIETLFILYLIRAFEDVLAGKGTGTTFNTITSDQLKEFEVPLPPLPEQHRIVAKIEELFTELDAGVEALKKIKAQLKRYRQAVLKYAFEGKLTEEWRKNVGAYGDTPDVGADLRVCPKKNENKKEGEHIGSPLQKPLQKNLPELPEGWVWTRVGQLYDIVGGGTPSTSVPKYWNGDIPWITSADIYGLKDIRPRKQITKEGIENSATNLVPAGSIIVVTRVGLGKVALTKTPICFSQDSQALVGNKSVIPDYALYYLSKAVQIFKYEHRGTTIAGVTKKQLAELPIPLPPLPEQYQIVSEIERRFSVADEVEKVVDQSLRQAQRLRQSILKRAFEGKLVTQNPSDEPADKLLEKIKQQREQVLNSKTKSDKSRRKSSVHISGRIG